MKRTKIRGAMSGFRRCVSLCRRRLSSKPRPSFITTPIFYVNAAPHIGHLYSALLADVAHRWRLMGEADPALFSTGTDEHGLKIQKVAAAQNKHPSVLCDEVSSKFKDMFDKAGISYTHYIRTTEPQHIQKVGELWEALCAQGHIYSGKYDGWYCIPDEAYLTDDQVTDSEEFGCKVSLESGHPVEWAEEVNYFFRLTAFREQLLEWVSTPPYPIVPEFARKLVVSWLREESFSDLSVSRPRSRLTWGIPVPGDDSQTIYVWLDALVNYLTVSGHPLPGHTWPPTEHVVGKDILRFHAIFWPAFLLAAGLELPRKIVTHSHWIVDKTKMSKSKGNVVDPLEQFSQFGTEQVRYYLLKEGFLHHDGDYSTDRLASVVNSDLANTLGNLLQRITSRQLATGGTGSRPQYRRDLFPLHNDDNSSTGSASEMDLDLINRLHELPVLVNKHYEEFEFSRGLDEVMQCLYHTNQLLERWAPWKLVKDKTQHSVVETILLVAMESLRLSACHLYPVIPHHCSQLLARLGYPSPPTHSALKCKLSNDGLTDLEEAFANLQLHKNSEPLFTKVTLKR